MTRPPNVRLDKSSIFYIESKVFYYFYFYFFVRRNLNPLDWYFANYSFVTLHITSGHFTMSPSLLTLLIRACTYKITHWGPLVSQINDALKWKSSWNLINTIMLIYTENTTHPAFKCWSITLTIYFFVILF